MKNLLLTIIAISLFHIPTAVYAEPAPVVVKEYSETRLKRSFRDRRHWRDRVNDLEGYYTERNSDGQQVFDIRPQVTPRPITAEVNCKYVERIDKHGQRSFDFICP